LLEEAVQEHFEEIADDDLLYRRLRADDVEVDGTVNSFAYSLRKDENYVSVNLARLTTEEDTMRPRPDLGLGQISAGDQSWPDHTSAA
jgi:hypothetical protein